MFATDYDAFVEKTDLNRSKPFEKREDITVYGLVGEMGSLVSAVKRRLIAQGDGQVWNIPTDEVIEELGDSLWYWSALSQLHRYNADEILKSDIQYVLENLTAKGKKGALFRKSVGVKRVAEFKSRSQTFQSLDRIDFSAYQDLAFLTRRTKGQVLIGVCLTVLSQLGTELLRKKFPAVEIDINTVVEPREVSVILGEVAWHLSAIATTFDLRIDEIATANKVKINRRLDSSKPTPPHDERYPSHEWFPRRFDVSFVMVGRGRSRMYMDGKQLGDELSDNSYSDDGYRFHDVMHLACVANLDWSPVLRGLLGLKRKSNPNIDEIEDGARARIVEEAVLKAIHSEGQKVSKPRQIAAGDKLVQFFISKNEISFRFLDFIANLTRGLEVEKNKYWEWENAIVQGNEVFWKLRQEGQGTVTVDLDARRISFCPDVYVEAAGPVVSIGSAAVDMGSLNEFTESARSDEKLSGSSKRREPSDIRQFNALREQAAKEAILEALGLTFKQANLHNLAVRPFKNGYSIKAVGDVREAIWRRKIISFRLTFCERQEIVICTALAIA